MKMKKLVAVMLVLALVAALCAIFVGCGEKTDEFKIALICLHDENSTYDKNFIDAFKEAQATLGLSDDQVIIVTGIEEGDGCYQEACKLADDGVDVIFADSFGHEPYLIKAAQKYPNVQFCHATGTRAHTEGLANYHNAFASIYEGRFLAGVAAGMKIKEMIDAGTITAAQAKMGYVGAFPYAEVISGYTSFYLGAKYIVPEVTMEVTFTGSWYDETAEKNAANNLISRDCVLISQHADSWGAPTACEDAGIPNVSYNGSTISKCANTFIVSSRINWAPYYVYAVNQVKAGEAIAADWTGTIATGSVELTAVNTAVAAAGTQTKIDELKAELAAGTLHVFDVEKDNYITVNGAKLTTYLADVDDMGDYEGETEAVSGGYFHESEYRSAPYFALAIDGITNIDED